MFTSLADFSSLHGTNRCLSVSTKAFESKRSSIRDSIAVTMKFSWKIGFVLKRLRDFRADSKPYYEVMYKYSTLNDSKNVAELPWPLRFREIDSLWSKDEKSREKCPKRSAQFELYRVYQTRWYIVDRNWQRAFQDLFRCRRGFLLSRCTHSLRHPVYFTRVSRLTDNSALIQLDGFVKETRSNTQGSSLLLKSSVTDPSE